MRRHSPRQGQEGLEPVVLRVGVVRDLLPGIGPTQDCANGHEHNLVEHVNFSMFASRIGKLGKVLEDRGGVFGTRTRMGNGLGVDRHVIGIDLCDRAVRDLPQEPVPIGGADDVARPRLELLRRPNEQRRHRQVLPQPVQVLRGAVGPVLGDGLGAGPRPHPALDRLELVPVVPVPVLGPGVDQPLGLDAVEVFLDRRMHGAQAAHR